jgi:xanthine dehydrogenase YagR molybdenum-binding subunit
MTTASQARALVGPGVDRVEGGRKVTGAAAYPTDATYPNLAYAALVRSTIAVGKIIAIDTRAAKAAPGVLTVITHENAPTIRRARRHLITPPPDPPLQ